MNDEMLTSLLENAEIEDYNRIDINDFEAFLEELSADDDDDDDLENDEDSDQTGEDEVD